jgi:soluble lytic murein transglycosylase-like protein
MKILGKLIFELALVLITAISLNHLCNELENGYKIYQIGKKLVDQKKKLVLKIPEKYRNYAIRLCRENNVPIVLFYKLVKTESNWNHRAFNRNSNGTADRGLCQINSCNYRHFSKYFYTGEGRMDLYNGFTSIEVSVKFLASLRKQHKNWKETVMAYNCGSYRVTRNRVPKITKLYCKLIFRNIEDLI